MKYFLTVASPRLYIVYYMFNVDGSVAIIFVYQDIYYERNIFDLITSIIEGGIDLIKL